MNSSKPFPPKVPDRAGESIALLVAVVFAAIPGFAALIDFRVGGPIVTAVSPLVVVALAGWFFLRRRRLRARAAKERLYDRLREI